MYESDNIIIVMFVDSFVPPCHISTYRYQIVKIADVKPSYNTIMAKTLDGHMRDEKIYFNVPKDFLVTKKFVKPMCACLISPTEEEIEKTKLEIMAKLIKSNNINLKNYYEKIGKH